MHRRPFTTNEFAYWLQGALEIGEIECLTREQVRRILRRMNDIPVKDLYATMVWTVLATYPLEKATGMVQYIQEQLFIHDIDPTYEGDQEFFHAVHRGEISVL